MTREEERHPLDSGETVGYKEDKGKPDWSLIPYDVIQCVVKVFTDGAKKYTRHNWRAGMVWSRPYAAAQRHLTAFWEGEDMDKDSGHHHLSHVMAEVIFLLYFTLHKRYKIHDDRYGSGRDKIVETIVKGHTHEISKEAGHGERNG